MWWILWVPIGVLGILLGVLVALSPGRPSPVVDGQGRPVPGSISQKVRVDINGTEQGMFIRGSNEANPVLLFVHGGAGMPEYFLAQRYPEALAVLERHFTVAWWERRGSGLSYASEVSPEDMTVEQMVSDLLTVADYLRERFSREKIYLMAHSGGTFFALQAVARSPEPFHAYIAVAQIAYQLESENVAYQSMFERFRDQGDTDMARRLEEGPVAMAVPLPSAYMRIRDKAMHRLGVGTTREMRSVLTGVFLPSLMSPDYTVREKVNIWRGKRLSDRLLWDTILATDLATTVTRVSVPVYFLHGWHDLTVTLPETKAFFQALEAPLKGFYTFANSAHSPMLEEPDRLDRIFERDVLEGKTSLADPM